MANTSNNFDLSFQKFQLVILEFAQLNNLNSKSFLPITNKIRLIDLTTEPFPQIISSRILILPNTYFLYNISILNSFGCNDLWV
jgi:hypothetical protein